MALLTAGFIHSPHKIISTVCGFSLLIKFIPLYFYIIYVKEEHVTETNENNDFTTMIPIWDYFVLY